MDPSSHSSKEAVVENIAGNLTAISVAAYQRAPTLLASDGDSRGAVQVWAPDEKLICKSIRATLLLAAGMLALGIVLAWSIQLVTHRPLDPVTCISFTVLPMFGLSELARARKHPRYLATDCAGIAITTASGTRSLRWDEIDGVGCGIAEDLDITIASRKRVQLLLTGFSAQDKLSLRNLIVERAQLVADPKTPKTFRRTALAESRTHPTTDKT